MKISRSSLASTLVLALIAVGLGAATLVFQSPSIDALEPQTGLPTTPRTDTPRVIGGTITDQAQLGDQIIVVGTFEQVRDNDGTVLEQKYIVSYDINSGLVNRNFDPVLDREAITVEPDGLGGVVIGGKFNSIDGATQRKLARLDSTGARVAAFSAEANAKVTHIAVRNNRAYVGGPFGAVKTDGTWSDRSLLAALHLADGSLDANFDFPITGPAGRGGELSVKGLGFANDDLVVSHSGTTVAGETRVAAAIITTTPISTPQLRAWTTDFFKTNTVDAGGQLANTEMAVSPDGSYFVVVSSGGDKPLQGRDSAVRFPVAGDAGVEPDWISRHFDSLFAVGISDQAVFIGGHFQFQEAPGSPNPFPGDPEVNYGVGPEGDGANALGNQVVARQQIGALDPVTGKSLNWNPGSSAEIGVESLVVIDRGLLVGQDGDVLGDKNIGRHGFFDITREVVREPDLTTSITSHFDAQTVDAGVVTLAGQATDTIGVGRVQLAIMHEDTRLWLQEDGSLGSWTGLNATLTSAGTPATAWSIDQEFQQTGSYLVQAKTFTTDGRKDPNPAASSIIVRPGDDMAPNVEFDTATVVERTITMSGIATDDRGVANVSVAVRDRDTGEYLQANGSIGKAANSSEATLAAIDAPSTTWTLQVVVPRNGRYQLIAEVVDTAGQDDEKFEFESVIVAANDMAPTIELAAGNIESPSDEPLVITMTVADDIIIDYAAVRLKEQLTADGTRPDNTFGGSGALVRIPGAADQRNHTFTYTSPDLPHGNYALTVLVVDGLGQRTITTRQVEVGAVGDARPANTMRNRTVYEAGPTLSLTGTASDDIGVQRVDLFVRDMTAKRWLASDGTFTSMPTAHSVQVDTPLARSADWSWSFVAPNEGHYRIYALPIDSDGQRASISWKTAANHWYLPDDALPVAGLISPQSGATVDERIFVTGRATDDVSVDRLLIRVRREADRKYLRSDGTFAGSQWYDAELSNPERPGTNWDWASPVLEPGEYRVEIRALDNHERADVETVFVTVR